MCMINHRGYAPEVGRVGAKKAYKQKRAGPGEDGCQIDAQTVMGKHGRQGRKGTAHVVLTTEKQPGER